MNPTSGVVPIKAAKLVVACSSCNLRTLCLPLGLPGAELERLDSLILTRRTLRRGEALFRTGDAFTALYAVRTGFFKTRVSSHDGRDQVTGFQMAGELLGMDGIATDAHTCDAVALEDSQVCIIPFGELGRASRECEDLQHQLYRIMSGEIVRDHGVMLLLGRMQAEERVAAFLLNLTQRLHQRGFSSSSLVLRMTREEIGSYLGLKLETVSRCFSKLQQDGVLKVRHRHLEVLDPAALRHIVEGATP